VTKLGALRACYNDVALSNPRLPLSTEPARALVDAFSHHSRAIHDGDIGAVHQTRVASRRLREVLPLLPLEPARIRALRHRVRRITRQLGPIRELDVLGLLARELSEQPHYAGAALTQLAASIDQEGAQARRRLAAKLPAAKLARLADDLALAVEPAGLSADHTRGSLEAAERTSADVYEKRLARRSEHVRLAAERAGVLYIPERLHAVRITVKKLRYAIEPLVAGGDAELTSDVAALKEVQDQLGRLHDLEVLIARIRDRQAAGPLPSVADWRELTRLLGRLESDCRVLHARYLHDHPRVIAVANRLGAPARRPAGIERRAAG
jgi:CHAD domain-containing protein